MTKGQYETRSGGPRCENRWSWAIRKKGERPLWCWSWAIAECGDVVTICRGIDSDLEDKTQISHAIFASDLDEAQTQRWLQIWAEGVVGRLVSCLLHRALFSYEDYQYLDMYQPLHNHCQMVYLLEKHFEMSMKLTSTISPHSDNFSCNVHWVIPPNYAHKQRRRVDITSPIVYELEFYGHILNWQKKKS